MTVYDLWLPIIATGLATHVWSTLAWVVLPHHKTEWGKFPAEDELQALIAKHQYSSGQFIFPFAASPKDAETDEYKRKEQQNRGTLVLWASPTNMVKAIVCTLSFFFVAAFMIAYLASIAVPAGAPFMKVFQFVSTAGLLTHCAAKFPNVFWFRRKIAMDLLDGVVIAMLTGLIFSALWPA